MEHVRCGDERGRGGGEGGKRRGRVIAEPFDALPAGRMAVLADPEGAVFCVWEARERKGAQLVNDAGAWSWSGLNTRGPERAKAFYAAVFGWEIETMGTGDAEHTMFRVPGYVGGRREQPVSREVVAGMSPMTVDRDDAPHWSIDFWVDNVDAIAGKAGELGGRAVVAPYDTPIARQAVLADPQGAMFSVSKVRVPTEPSEGNHERRVSRRVGGVQSSARRRAPACDRVVSCAARLRPWPETTCKR